MARYKQMLTFAEFVEQKCSEFNIDPLDKDQRQGVLNLAMNNESTDTVHNYLRGLCTMIDMYNEYQQTHLKNVKKEEDWWKCNFCGHKTLQMTAEDCTICRTSFVTCKKCHHNAYCNTCVSAFCVEHRKLCETCKHLTCRCLHICRSIRGSTFGST